MRGPLVAAALCFAASTNAPAQAQVGEPAPELTFDSCRNVDAGPAQLSDLRGAAVLLEFSATWCGPCKAMIPRLNKLHETFAERGLVVLGVLDEGAGKVEPWLAQHAVAHPIALVAKGHAATAYALRAFPTAVLVGPDGLVAWTGHPGQLTDATVERALSGANSPLARLKDQLEPVQGLLDRGQKGRAIAMLRVMQKSGKLDAGPAQLAAAVQKRLEQQAGWLLLKATEADRDRFSAALLLQQTVLEFEGHDAAAMASARLSTLAKDAAAVREVEAAACILRARELSRARRYGDAIAEYQKACLGDGTPAQKTAAAAIAAIEASGLAGFRADCPDCVGAGKACTAHGNARDR